MAGGTAEIGIRVYLDDAASAGLSSVSSGLGRLGQQANSASAAFGLMSGRMAQFGVIAGVAASFALFAAALKYSYDQASQLQQSLFGIAIATHEPMAAAVAYAGTLMNLAATSTYTTSQLSDGVAVLGRSSFSLHDIFTQLRSGTMTMAEAGRDLGIAIRTDAVSAFTLLGQTMRAYNLPAVEAEHTANLLQFAFERQRGSVSDFRTGLAQVTPDASRFGVSLREVLTALDVVGPQMNNTARAGTALRYMIDGLYTPTDKAKNEMKALGLGAFDASGNFHSLFYDTQGKAIDFARAVQILNDHLKGMNQEARNNALTNLFSTRGGQGAKALLGDIPLFLALLKQLNQTADNSGGVFRRWQEQMNTAAGAIGGLKSSLTDLGAVIGTYILPYVTQAAQELNRLVTIIRTSVAANPAAVVQFLLLGGAITGVATVVILLMTPMGQLVGLIILVAAGAMLLVAGLMIAANWFRNLYASSALVRSILGNLGAIFNEVGAAAKDALAQALETINEVLAQTHFKMSDLAVIGKVLLVVLGTIAALLLGVLVGAIRGTILALAMFIAGLVLFIAGIGQFVAGVLQLFKGLFDVIVGLVTGNGAMVTHGFALMRDGSLNIIRGLVTALIGLFIGIFGTIIGFIVGFVQGVISWFQHLSAVLVGHSIVPDMLNAIRNAFISVLSSIVGFVGGIINRIIAFFVQLGSRAVSAVSSAFSTIRSVVSSALNSVVGVVGSIFNSIVSRIVSAGASIRNAVSSAFNTARSIVQSNMAFMGAVVAYGWAIIVARVSSAGNAVRNAVSSAFNAARSAAASALAAIVGVVSSGFNSVVSHVSAAGSFIISRVSSAFNSARAAAASAISAIVGTVSSGFNAVISHVSAAGAFIVSRVSSAFNSARAAAAGALASIVGVVSGGMSAVIGRISSAGSSIIATMSNAWNSARNAAASGVAGVVGLAASAPGRIMGVLGGLPGMLFAFGAHAMSSFAAGLQSALGAVVNAVASAAASVASFLHHSAPPTAGPLANDDQWMPHMIQMMAEGIDRHAPLLKDAINRAAGGMAPGFSSIPQVARIGTPSPASINVAGGGGSKVVQLVVDGRILGQAVMDDWTGRLQLNGGGRAFR